MANTLKTRLALVIIAVWTVGANAEMIWTGPKTPFTKLDFADPSEEANQDRITDNVWITRDDTEGIFNIKAEAGFARSLSPADTEWAFGTTDNMPAQFDNWAAWHGGKPLTTIGQDAVLHLITDDVFVDIKFLSWTQGQGGGVGDGGGFSYERSTIPEPSTLALFALGLPGLALFVYRRRRR